VQPCLRFPLGRPKILLDLAVASSLGVFALSINDAFLRLFPAPCFYEDQRPISQPSKVLLLQNFSFPLPSFLQAAVTVTARESRRPLTLMHFLTLLPSISRLSAHFFRSVSVLALVLLLAGGIPPPLCFCFRNSHADVRAAILA